MGRGKYDTCKNCIYYESKGRSKIGICNYSRKPEAVEEDDWCKRHTSEDE